MLLDRYWLGTLSHTCILPFLMISLANDEILRRKWAFALFAKTCQQNAPYLKLISEMLLFWNSIFGQSSYSKWKIFKNKINSRTQVPCKALDFHELKYHVKYSSSWNSSSLKKFKWNSSSKKIKKKNFS